MKTASICTLLLLSCPVLASSQGLPSFAGNTHELGLDENGVAPGDVTRSVCGDIDGDGRLDFAALKDGELIGALNPAVYSQVFATGQYVDDFAIRRGPLHSGEDRAYSVSSSGLYSWSFDEQAVKWNRDSTALLSQPGICLRNGLIDGDDVEDLVLLLADGRSLVSLTFVTDYENTHAQNSMFLLPAATTDFALLDWDDDGRDEIAVVQSGYLEIRSSNGTVLDSVLALPGITHLTTLRSPGGDALAWHVPDFMGVYQWLFAMRSGTSGVELEGPINLSGFQLAAMGAGDFDGDDHPELFLLPETSKYLVMIQNDNNWGNSNDCFDFGSNDNVEFELGEPSQGDVRAALPVLGDFDDDGDNDLLIANRATDALHVFKGTETDEEALLPTRAYMEICGGTDNMWFFVNQPPVLSTPTNFDRVDEVEVSLFWTTPEEPLLRPYAPMPSQVFDIGAVSFQLPEIDDPGVAFTLELRFRYGDLAFPSVMSSMSKDLDVVDELCLIQSQATGVPMLVPERIVWCNSGPGGPSTGPIYLDPILKALFGPAPVEGSGDIPEQYTRPFSLPN